MTNEHNKRAERWEPPPHMDDSDLCLSASSFPHPRPLLLKQKKVTVLNPSGLPPKKEKNKKRKKKFELGKCTQQMNRKWKEGEKKNTKKTHPKNGKNHMNMNWKNPGETTPLHVVSGESLNPWPTSGDGKVEALHKSIPVDCQARCETRGWVGVCVGVAASPVGWGRCWDEDFKPQGAMQSRQSASGQLSRLYEM